MTMIWLCSDCAGVDSEVAYRWWKDAQTELLENIKGGKTRANMRPGTYPAQIGDTCAECGGASHYDRIGYLLPFVEKVLTRRAS